MRTVMDAVDDKQKGFLPLDYRQCCSHILKDILTQYKEYKIILFIYY